MAYAHSPNDAGTWHELTDHLRDVAALAAGFAAEFGAEAAGRRLGLWHDAGKFAPRWQQYLVDNHAGRVPKGGPDHKAAGAALAYELGNAWPLAMLVQAHHGGLRTREDLAAFLKKRGEEPETRAAIALARAALPELAEPGRVPLPAHATGGPLGAELFFRMLFSALIDADRLDTEGHDRPERTAARGGAAPLAELWRRLERAQAAFADAEQTPVNRVRADIYADCLAAAEQEPGLFRLAVPTGGGKTRSGMAFALRHALRHGMRRVIVAVPFITITEQTAQTYRAMFAEADDAAPAVLEHHSGPKAPDDDRDADDLWPRLAAENWDAPIIVTTTVQLFESLFAARTSAIRKAHRLANSVIILDEAQALPGHLLDPILDAVRGLCRDYHTTVVLSTATQPAFEIIPAFAGAGGREIVPHPERHFAALRRVAYEWRHEPALAWEEVAGLMRAEKSALAVLNTKRDALDLLEALHDPAALHLSTMLCGAHRQRVIAEVRRRLAAGEPCRLVATQVVEAGVDLDFPLVVRALGPLDGIIQAAGRCNREGRLAAPGRVIVFRPEGDRMPAGNYRTAAGITDTMIGSGTLDPDDPVVARAYFTRLFQTVTTDREGIQALRGRLDYPAIAERFKMIDDDSEVVAISGYGAEDERSQVAGLLAELRRGTPRARAVWRELQPYLVNVRRREAATYRNEGFLVEVTEGLGEWLGRYDSVRGMVAADQDYIG